MHLNILTKHHPYKKTFCSKTSANEKPYIYISSSLNNSIHQIVNNKKTHKLLTTKLRKKNELENSIFKLSWYDKKLFFPKRHTFSCRDTARTCSLSHDPTPKVTYINSSTSCQNIRKPQYIIYKKNWPNKFSLSHTFSSINKNRYLSIHPQTGPRFDKNDFANPKI